LGGVDKFFQKYRINNTKPDAGKLFVAAFIGGYYGGVLNLIIR
jgi:hypothetical protein